jgi:hypothetical protein
MKLTIKIQDARFMMQDRIVDSPWSTTKMMQETGLND